MAGIAGEVYDDLINRGVKDRVEGGLSGWTIFIDEDRDGQFDRGEYSAITSTTGGYYLPGLAPGLHHVQAIAPEGFEHTTPDVWQVFLSPGESNFTVDFGGLTI